MHPLTSTQQLLWTREQEVCSFLHRHVVSPVGFWQLVCINLYTCNKYDFIQFEFLIKNLRYPFAAQGVPLPHSKSTPIEVTNALQRNQSILVSLAVSMNARSQSFYMENGNLGWPVPSLKQLFSSAVTYKKKFQKGIISSWEGYNSNHVSLTIYMQSIFISEIVWLIDILYATYRIVCGFITGCCFNLSFQTWQLSPPMTWKTLILVEVLFFHSSMEIGKNSFVTWTRGCDTTTTSIMKNCQSLDWFGWVNVLSPTFRIICYILECDVFLGVSS